MERTLSQTQQETPNLGNILNLTVAFLDSFISHSFYVFFKEYSRWDIIPSNDFSHQIPEISDASPLFFLNFVEELLDSTGMPKNNIQKSLQSYLSKIKRETRNIQLSSSMSLSRKWGISHCKHPKTLSFSTMRKHRTSGDGGDVYEDGGGDDAATLADVDRFLQENFKSLCVEDEDGVDLEGKGGKKMNSGEDDGGSSEDEEVEKEPSRRRRRPVGFDWMKRSDRAFDICKLEKFFKNPGTSGENPWRSPGATTTTTTTTTADDVTSSSNSYSGPPRMEDDGRPRMALPENCIAVPKHTEDPYEDFRRSMLELVETKMVLTDLTLDWDFMEELLLCYLDLNDKASHRFILSAFVDLILVLRRSENSKDLVGSPIAGFSMEKSRRTKHS